MDTLELEWPVRRHVQVVSQQEMLGKLAQDEATVPLRLVDWNAPWPEYDQMMPAWILADVVRAVGRGWPLPPWERPAHQRGLGLIHINGRPVRYRDQYGRPLNPLGRSGRNVCSGWYWYPGANWAADGAVVSFDGRQWWVLMIQRHHGGRWALPGGMCDQGETPEQTGPREVFEETGFAPQGDEFWLSIRRGMIGRGLAYSWTEGELFLCQVAPARMGDRLEPQVGEARTAEWVPLQRLLAGDMPIHHGHAPLLRCVWAHVQGLART